MVQYLCCYRLVHLQPIRIAPVAAGAVFLIAFITDSCDNIFELVIARIRRSWCSLKKITCEGVTLGPRIGVGTMY